MNKPLITAEVRAFNSVTRDGVRLFPTPMVCTFVRFGGVWLMIRMASVDEEPK